MKVPTYPVFASEEYERRLLGVRARMAARGVDALVTTTPENIFYLTGYQTPGYYFFLALIVPMDKDPVLIPPPHEESTSEYRQERAADGVGSFEDLRVAPEVRASLIDHACMEIACFASHMVDSDA